MNFRFVKKYKITFIFLIIVFLYAFSWLISFDKNQQFRYGVTFSQPYAEHLGLDWKKVLTAILDDLQVQNYRLVAYWNLIEPGPGIYEFKDLDWQINEVAKRGGNVTLALGMRVPRWPECHIPTWAKNLTNEQLIEANKSYINEVVKHYSNLDNVNSIVALQVENEPFLKIFGECIEQSEQMVDEKVKIVDQVFKLPIAITESGELGLWYKTAKLADVLGVSVYRRVSQPFIGYINYPFPPLFYSARAWFISLLTDKQVYISELQLEPWINGDLIDAPLVEQEKAMSVEHLRDFVAYARKTGLNPIYFWGVEWWYYMKEQGNSDYWNEMKRQIEINSEKL